MEDLLPCPFCPENEAKKAKPMILFKKRKGFDNLNFTVQCTNCGCEPDFCVESEDEAVSHWNSRVLLPDTDASIVGFNTAKKRIIELIKILNIKKVKENNETN